MEKVGKVAANFKDNVEVQMKLTKSKEAQEYGLQNPCIIVDCAIRLPTDFEESQLEEAIRRRLENRTTT
jgi:hypothetical protein